MATIIRRATPSDTAIVVEFNGRLAQETEGKSLDPNLIQPGVEAVLADSAKGEYFLAVENGRILGQLMLTREWSDWRNGWFWWIQSVYVRVEARRQGIYRRLHEFVVEQAKAGPAVIGIRLYVERDNEKAQRTYQSLGMRATSYLLFEQWPL